MMSNHRYSLVFVSIVILLASACEMAQEQREAAQDQHSEFHWSGKLAPDQILEIKNISGAIVANGYDGDQVEVTAEKTGPDADSVRIEVVPNAEGVTICTIYPGGRTGATSGPCESGKNWQVNSHNTKAKVSFTIRVPANLRFAATSINSDITAENMGRFVRANTVNGSVRVSTKQWAELTSVNGSLEARMGSAGWTGELKLSSVNGSIELAMPSNLNADVEFSSVNGHLDCDFPISTNRTESRHIEGKIGNGGRELVLDTVNGNVHLKRESS